MTRVLVFGVFDFFHPGHLGFLRMAANQGDELIVSVARDVFVLSHKKKKPMFTEDERCGRIAELPFVSRAVLSDTEPGHYSVIKKYMPGLVCFGHDQNKLQEHCENWLAENDLAVKTIKLDIVDHIKKDFAFLRPDNNTLPGNPAFEHFSSYYSESANGDAFCVYNRSAELKAVIFRNPGSAEADVSVFFENRRQAGEPDNSLLRESAFFISFYRDIIKKTFVLDFPGTENGGTVEINIE